MDPSPPLISKKLCDMVRVAFFMIQKGVSKTKFVFDLSLVMKQGNKILKEAVNDLMLHHQDAIISCRPSDVDMSFVSPRAISCRPDDANLAFVSPREYEFSCSSSPVHQVFHNPFQNSKHRNYYTRKNHWRNYKQVKPQTFNSGGDDRRTPLVRKVKIRPRDSYDIEQDYHVDIEAEKFIDRFYSELRLQKWMAALEPVDYYG